MHDREPCVMRAFLEESLLRNWLDRSGAHVGAFLKWLKGTGVLQHCEDVFQPTLSLSQHPVQTRVLPVCDLTSLCASQQSTRQTVDLPSSWLF